MGREETTIDLKKLGKKPQYAICQFCHARALTRLERYVEEGGINGLMLFFCCCYPITVYWLFYGKDIAYYCGSCNRVMAKRMRIDGEIRVVEPTTGRETKVAPDQDQHFDDST